VIFTFYGGRVSEALETAVANGTKLEEVYVEDMDLPAMMITYLKSNEVDRGMLTGTYGMGYTRPYLVMEATYPIVRLVQPYAKDGIYAGMEAQRVISMQPPGVDDAPKMLPYRRLTDQLLEKDFSMCLICDASATVVNLHRVKVVRSQDSLYYFCVNVNYREVPQIGAESGLEAFIALGSTMSRALLSTPSEVIHGSVYIEGGPLSRGILRGIIGPIELLMENMERVVARQYLSIIAQSSFDRTIKLTEGDGSRGAANAFHMLKVGLEMRNGISTATTDKMVTALQTPASYPILISLLGYSGFVIQRNILTDAFHGTMAEIKSPGMVTTAAFEAAKQMLYNLGGLYRADLRNPDLHDHVSAMKNFRNRIIEGMRDTFSGLMEALEAAAVDTSSNDTYMRARTAILGALQLLQ
jgi:hypothetical protein